MKLVNRQVNLENKLMYLNLLHQYNQGNDTEKRSMQVMQHKRQQQLVNEDYKMETHIHKVLREFAHQSSHFHHFLHKD